MTEFQEQVKLWIKSLKDFHPKNKLTIPNENDIRNLETRLKRRGLLVK